MSLADVIARDLLREQERPASDVCTCFACGRGFTNRGPEGDDSGRFCSIRCREAFDAGFPPRGVLAQVGPKLDRIKRRGKTGFVVDCAGCRKEFDSRGVRCCSVECERAFRRKEEWDIELAQDPFRVTKRKCADCGGAIPNWRKGRRVSKATRFCSPRCSKRSARKSVLDPRVSEAALSVETQEKCRENVGCLEGAGMSTAWLSAVTDVEFNAIDQRVASLIAFRTAHITSHDGSIWLGHSAVALTLRISEREARDSISRLVRRGYLHDLPNVGVTRQGSAGGPGSRRVRLAMSRIGRHAPA